MQTNTKTRTLVTKSIADAVEEAKSLIQTERSGNINGLYVRWPGVNNFMMKYWRFGSVTAMGGMSGCHASGTKVIMYDGTMKKVEDITKGDLLMGIDSTPRTVLNLIRGRDKMYWVRQNKGLDYRVNGDHILCLKERSRFQKNKELNDVGKVCNISVKDYLKKNSTYTYYHKGWKIGINFMSKDVPMDAYFLGLWLGDGSINSPSITSMDNEIVEYLQKCANFLEYELRKETKPNNKASTYHLSNIKGKANRVTTILRELGVCYKKNIPDIYLYNDRNIRLELLAGLIDTDGSYDKKGKSFEISSSREDFATQIAYLVRSLGFYSSLSKKRSSIKSTGFEGVAYRITIYGNNLSEIPTKVARKRGENSSKTIDPLVTGITIEEDIEDNYYGFSLDGDNLYLLEDFTVTHNSGKSAILNMIESDFTNPELNPTFLRHKDGNGNWIGEDKIMILAFKYEMSAADELLRTLSGISQKSYAYLLSSETTGEGYNRVTDSEYETFVTHLDALKNKPIKFIENSGNLEELKATCAYYKEKFPARRLIITIDHTLLSKKLSERDDLELVANTAQTAIELRKNLGAMVIFLCQMNGEIEKPARRENLKLQIPVKTDLHCANQLFWACDNVLIWHRPELLNIERYGDFKGRGGSFSVDCRGIIHCAYIKSRKNKTGNGWFRNEFNIGNMSQIRSEDIKWKFGQTQLE